MAYEVLKTIGGHRYRYTVESYRDPDTGKVKNKWTYAGRADEGAQSRAARRASGDAKLSSATFYRHFKSRDDLVGFCTQRAMNDLDKRLSALQDIAGNAKDERLRLRSLAMDLVRSPSAPPALFRAWSVLSPEKVRRERHARRISAFSTYIEELANRDYIERPEHVRRLAVALSVIVHTFTRLSVIENRLLSEEDYAVVGDTFTRLVFLCE
jgi:AcrR family transcriptional regulator